MGEKSPFAGFFACPRMSAFGGFTPMSQMQSTGACDKLAITLLISAAVTPPDPPLKGAKLMLYSSTVVPRKDLTIDDLTECVFSGYARSAGVVWNAPVKESDGTYSASSPSKQFQATSA